MCRSVGRTVALASVALLATACYVYVPVGAEQPVAGERLRAQLADSGSAAVVSRLGPGVVAVEGALVQAQPPRFTLAVDAFNTPQMGRVPWSGEAIELSRAGMSTLEVRRFSRTRTVAFIGALAVGGLLLDRRIFGGGNVGPDEGQGPQQPK